MTYERKWLCGRNASGFAAECARLALPFYEGDHRLDLVAAIDLVERYTDGERLDIATARAAYTATYDAYVAADLSCAACAAYAVNSALYTAITSRAARYAHSAFRAAAAGVDDHKIRAAFARWVVRDLSDGRELPEELRQAAGAAVVAGSEAIARELLA